MKQTALLIGLLLLAACEPLGPFAGRGLDGVPATPPPNWSKLNWAEVVQLETGGPYSVNIWGVGLDSGYYVVAANNDSRWARRIGRDAEVRLRIDGKLYPLRAEVVVDEAALADIRIAFDRKYDLENSEDFPDAIVYQLVPR